MFEKEALQFARDNGYTSIKCLYMSYGDYEVYKIINHDEISNTDNEVNAKFILAKNNEIRFTKLIEYLNIISYNLDNFNYTKEPNDPYYLFESYGDELKIGERIIVSLSGDIDYYKIDDNQSQFIHDTYHSDEVIDKLKNILLSHENFKNEMDNVKVLNEEFNNLKAWDEKVILDDLKFIVHSPTKHSDDELLSFKDKKEIQNNLLLENEYINLSNDIRQVIDDIKNNNSNNSNNSNENN